MVISLVCVSIPMLDNCILQRILVALTMNIHSSEQVFSLKISIITTTITTIVSQLVTTHLVTESMMCELLNLSYSVVG